MSEIVTVYALKDLPHITGVDMKEYGWPDGFKEGQAMKIPRENAESLVRYGVASKHPQATWKYFNYSHYVRTEDEANRLLKRVLKDKILREGWVCDDGSKTHAWVVRGVKRR